MNVTISKTFAWSTAVGALALCAAMILPSAGAQAAEFGGRAAIGAAQGAAPVEMQHRHRHFGGHRHGGYRHHHHHGRGWRGGNGALIGAGAAALIIGGAAAAAAASGPRDCWIERRWVEGPYGPERRNVRICD